MAKTPLAVKYRPKTFDDMTEQSAIKDILENQIRTKTFQHGYLFTGPAGTGKTTSARIFANMINDGKGNPIEVDAASNSGVDNIRGIIEDAKRKPLDAEYKIFIIDECHSLSSGAWQALLKTLEESPKYAIFILCTTNPEKIPATILSRVQQYQFQKISNDGIFTRLYTIMDDEGYADCDKVIDEDSLRYIAKVANGGMRDAITLLDKCLSLSSNLTIENVLRTIGAENYDTFISFLVSLQLKNEEKTIATIENIYNDGKDVKQFLKDFVKFVLEVKKYFLYNNFDYISLPNSMEKRLEELRDINTFEVIDLIVDINNKIKWDSDPKTLIELSIILFCEG